MLRARVRSGHRGSPPCCRYRLLRLNRDTVGEHPTRARLTCTRSSRALSHRLFSSNALVALPFVLSNRADPRCLFRSVLVLTSAQPWQPQRLTGRCPLCRFVGAASPMGFRRSRRHGPNAEGFPRGVPSLPYCRAGSHRCRRPLPEPPRQCTCVFAVDIALQLAHATLRRGKALPNRTTCLQMEYRVSQHLVVLHRRSFSSGLGRAMHRTSHNRSGVKAGPTQAARLADCARPPRLNCVCLFIVCQCDAVR